MTSHLLSFEQAKVLPIGTVLFFADTARKKEENRVYCIVTETGINYFQYTWYQKKFEFDPASHGVGIPVALYNNTQFIRVGIEPIDVNKKKNFTA
jgi:hypothetical protein